MSLTKEIIVKTWFENGGRVGEKEANFIIINAIHKSVAFKKQRAQIAVQ